MPTSPAEHLRLYETEPIEEGGATSWYARAQNFVVSHSTLPEGAALPVESSEDEYFIVLINGTVHVASEAGEASVTGRAQVIVPPGSSTVTAETPATLVRVFAPPTPELLAKCVNAGSYDEPHHNVAPFERWPEPVDGYRLQVYEYDQLPENARIFRSRNIMVNWGGNFAPPRDRTRLTPHHHDDFEQMSVCISGTYIHHIRYPWEADGTTWLEDEHVEIATPSITIMPPPAIHTSQGVGPDNSLIDVFAPPRADFSLAGRVYEENAQTYPLPPSLTNGNEA